MTSVLHDLTYFLTVTVCTCCQHDFGNQEKDLCLSILVGANCKAVISMPMSGKPSLVDAASIEMI